MSVSRTPRSAAIAIGALCVVGLAMFGLGRMQTMAEPSSVGVVNMRVLEEKLDMKRDHDAEINTIGQNLVDQVNALKEEIKQDVENLQGLALSREEQFEREQAIMEKRGMVMGREETSLWIIEFERSRRLLERYAAIVDASERLAEEQGYDIVLMRSDEAARGPMIDIDQLADPSQLDGLTGKIRDEILLLRNQLYVNDAIDITDQLAIKMNNEYNAVSERQP